MNLEFVVLPSVDDHDLDHMQIRLDGSEWHRPIPGGEYVACGRRIDPKTRGSIRHETLVGELCRDCFQPFELAINEYENEQERKRNA